MTDMNHEQMFECCWLVKRKMTTLATVPHTPHSQYMGSYSNKDCRWSSVYEV